MASSYPAAAGAILVVVLASLAIVTATGFAYANNTPAVNRTDAENLTVDYYNDSQLAHGGTALEYSDLTLTNSSNTTLDEGTDYEFDPSSGQVDWRNTTRTTDGETVRAEYAYTVHPRETRVILGVVRPVTGTILPYLAVLVGGVGTVVAVASAGWGLYRVVGAGSRGGGYGRR